MKISQKSNNTSAKEVKKLFSSIAVKYDKVNRFITLGMDTKWRKKLVQWSKAPKHGKILDCATGTGALAFEFQKQMGAKVQITGVDFCEEMLKQACKKAEQNISFASNSQQNLNPKGRDFKNIHFQLADIQKLPFPENIFDICSMAYGLRNTEDPLKALREMARVTKPGGTILILETGDKPMPLLLPFFYLHFRYVVPFLGGRITGQKSAYQYLQKTSQSFPARRFFLKLMKDTKCFDNCEYKALFFGASFIYKARVAKHIPEPKP